MKQLWLKWKRRWLPYLIAYSAKYAMRLLIRTCRIHVHGIDTFIACAKQSPCILMLWHDKLVVVPEIMNRFTSNLVFTAVISKSRDGDPLAILTNSYSIGRVLRVGHHTRHKALSHMINILKGEKGIILITPDGPRGPRHVIKPGVAVAARESSTKIFSFSWKAKSFWQLNTWDKMQIPKPFTTLNVTFGQAVMLPESDKSSLEQDIRILQDYLD